MAPTSARERFGIRLTTVSRRWRRALDHRLALAGHTDTSWAPLIHLEAGGDGLSQKALAKRVGMEGSSLVRHLDRLESRGLVRRQSDPRDRRTKRVFLTPAGRDAVTTLRADLLAAEMALLDDLDDARLETLVEALDIIDRRLQSDAEGTEEPS
ncbi:MarR family winged helix-turn-helix transcriptional regulator [Halomonas organivorans]|uniref:MarR family transcriptional regulator for hemolysin n=1 Tax=Halomonas organivorans TaxID=257772 RepID=A0A7W5G4M8_9GAMM|nr:MarR family transcriptional regulator [Halomonas organivorans]MBB3139506.1 MarR family transcriptional regulator for hemolysin [Halomonas organivorans]